MMKVRATRLGYYGDKRRREGVVFAIDEKDFSRKWMEKISAGDPAKPAKAERKSKKDEPVI